MCSVYPIDLRGSAVVHIKKKSDSYLTLSTGKRLRGDTEIKDDAEGVRSTSNNVDVLLSMIRGEEDHLEEIGALRNPPIWCKTI